MSWHAYRLERFWTARGASTWHTGKSRAKQRTSGELLEKLSNGVREDTGRRISDDSRLVNELTKRAHESTAAAHAAKHAHTNRTYDCGVPQGRQAKREKVLPPGSGEHGAGKHDIFPRGIKFWRPPRSGSSGNGKLSLIAKVGMAHQFQLKSKQRYGNYKAEVGLMIMLRVGG